MNKTLYESDFNQWLAQTVHLLQNGLYEQVDWENLIEEIKDLGEYDKRMIRSNMVIVILHLLEYIYQPNCRTDSWNDLIIEHRLRIEFDLENSPSLKRATEEYFLKCYQMARKQVAKQTKKDLADFPEEHPLVWSKCWETGCQIMHKHEATWRVIAVLRTARQKEAANIP